MHCCCSYNYICTSDNYNYICIVHLIRVNWVLKGDKSISSYIINFLDTVLLDEKMDHFEFQLSLIFLLFAAH